MGKNFIFNMTAVVSHYDIGSLYFQSGELQPKSVSATLSKLKSSPFVVGRLKTNVSVESNSKVFSLPHTGGNESCLPDSSDDVKYMKHKQTTSQLYPWKQLTRGQISSNS